MLQFPLYTPIKIWYICAVVYTHYKYFVLRHFADIRSVPSENKV